MSETLNYEVLAGQLNTKFSLMDSPEPFELELIEITEPKINDQQTSFSLYFRGNENFMLPQGSYRMNHEQLGETMFFIVPTSHESNGFKYEAVFNFLNAAN